jgi:hypothetical protein
MERGGGVVQHGVNEHFEVGEAQRGALGFVEEWEGGADDGLQGLEDEENVRVHNWCDEWNGRVTYIVDAASEVEQDGFSQLAPIDTVVLAELAVREGSRVDIHSHLLVIRAGLDHFTAERDKVVQGGEHLCSKPKPSKIRESVLKDEADARQDRAYPRGNR